MVSKTVPLGFDRIGSDIAKISRRRAEVLPLRIRLPHFIWCTGHYGAIPIEIHLRHQSRCARQSKPKKVDMLRSPRVVVLTPRGSTGLFSHRLV